MEAVLLLLLLGVPIPVSQVQTGELVVNGDFETGDTQGWTVDVDTVERCARGAQTNCWWISGSTLTHGLVSPAFEGSHMLRVRADSGSGGYTEGAIQVFQDLSPLNVPTSYLTTLRFYANVRRPDVSACPDCYGNLAIYVDFSNGTRSGREGVGAWGTPGAQSFVNGALNVIVVSAILSSDVKDPRNNYVFTEINFIIHSKHSGHQGFGLHSYTEADLDAISLTAVSPVREVGIDIKPGSFPNSINPESRGKIPVAILSSPGFDAPRQVNASTLTFGRTGNEQSLAFCQGSRDDDDDEQFEDVNGDGLPDLVCHFFTRMAVFQAGDTEGTLRGQLLDGSLIEGTDSVRIITNNR